MQRPALNRLLREGDAVSGAYLAGAALPGPRGGLCRSPKGMPRIAGVVEQASAIRAFHDTLAQSVLFFTFIAT